MIGVYARRITERIIELRLIPGSNTMVVFLGISLKDQGKDPEMFRVVVDVLMKLVREALAQLKAGWNIITMQYNALPKLRLEKAPF